MNTLNKIEIQLPFSGFYESMHDMYIDNFIEYELEYLENELGYTDEQLDIIKDRFYMMDYSPIRKAICEHYINAFNAVFYDEHNIHLDLKYSQLISPRFYNFETDRLYCTIDQDKFSEILLLLNDDKIQNVLSAKYKTRSGFIVFDSTLQAIKEKDYIKFSSDILEMLLSEDQIINDWQYTDNIHEVVSNAICVDYEL